jgi:hypothetical protein
MKCVRHVSGITPSGALKAKRIEKPNIFSFKPKGPNRIAKIGYGHLRKENLRFYNNYIFLPTRVFVL